MSVSSILLESIVRDENGEPVRIDEKILCNIINSEGERDVIPLDKQILVDGGFNFEEIDGNGEKKFEWTDEATKMILDKYDEYISEVGPMKQFKIKKRMWEQITNEINNIYSINRTAQHVENRFKTVLKRKKIAVQNNNTSGQQRIKIQFEEELRKIAAKDDSIEPEVMKDQENVIIKSVQEQPPRKKSKTVVDHLKAFNKEKQELRQRLHTEREENRERRHKEKLQLLRELFGKTE